MLVKRSQTRRGRERGGLLWQGRRIGLVWWWCVAGVRVWNNYLWTYNMQFVIKCSGHLGPNKAVLFFSFILLPYSNHFANEIQLHPHPHRHRPLLHLIPVLSNIFSSPKLLSSSKLGPLSSVNLLLPPPGPPFPPLAPVQSRSQRSQCSQRCQALPPPVITSACATARPIPTSLFPPTTTTRLESHPAVSTTAQPSRPSST